MTKNLTRNLHRLNNLSSPSSRKTSAQLCAWVYPGSTLKPHHGSRIIASQPKQSLGSASFRDDNAGDTFSFYRVLRNNGLSLTTISLVALILTACAGHQEVMPADAPQKTLDFSANRPKQVTVGPEDTVYGIAYEHGVSTKALVALNNIPAPYELRMGQVLDLPQANEHIVSSGETLDDVAATYGVNIDALARENEITTTASLSPQQRLTIPPADTDPVVVAPSPVIASGSLAPLPLVKVDEPKAAGKSMPSQAMALPDDLASELAEERGEVPVAKPVIHDKAKHAEIHEELDEELSAPAPKVEKSVSSKPKPSKLAEETPTDPSVKTAKDLPTKEVAKKEAPAKEEVVAEVTTFSWPVKGDVVSKFGAKSGKGKNDGINIKVPEGTAVKASQGGEVIYAGSELKGFGNLVLIKHPNGLKTAYAYNKELLVKKGDKVKQGQTIAKSGKNGDDSQLHFEIREGTKAIDPLTKLGS